MANDEDELLDPAEIEALLRSAGAGRTTRFDAAGKTDGPDRAAAARPFEFQAFDDVAGGDLTGKLSDPNDIELDIRIELGRTELPNEDVLKLREGSVVALDKLARDPVDILVNGRLIARGEVLVLDDNNFGVRVAEILAPALE